MKITESKLRRIIREVIAEASDEGDQEAALEDAVDDIKNKAEDFYKANISFSTGLAKMMRPD